LIKCQFIAVSIDWHQKIQHQLIKITFPNLRPASRHHEFEILSPND
jgi:hypothetical protein